MRRTVGDEIAGGRWLPHALMVVVGTFFLAAMVSFGVVTGCTDRYSCSSSWCSPCAAQNWVPIVYFAAQVVLAAVAGLRISRSASGAGERSIRRQWLGAAAVLSVALLTWALFWAN